MRILYTILFIFSFSVLNAQNGYVRSIPELDSAYTHYIDSVEKLAMLDDDIPNRDSLIVVYNIEVKENRAKYNECVDKYKGLIEQLSNEDEIIYDGKDSRNEERLHPIEYNIYRVKEDTTTLNIEIK